MDARQSLGQHAEPVATPQSTHQHSGQHHAITSGGHSSVSAGKSWLVSAKEAIRLFAYRAGIRLIAAGADVEVKSLSQNINMLAKLDITQTANRIEINAKEEVLMNGGGSYRRWSAGGIEEGTSGSWTAHAAGHDLNGPKNMPVVMPEFPVVEAGPFTVKYQLFKDDGRPFEGYAWKAFSNLSPMGEGSTNQTGLGAIVNNEGASATEVLKARRM